MEDNEQAGSYRHIQPFVEIMDCTLRDGEQTSGVSFLPHEKLMIARMLLHDLNVDRIEVASARISDGEQDAVSFLLLFVHAQMITPLLSSSAARSSPIKPTL